MGTPRKPRINTRKIYEDAYGKLPAGMEVHHKLPSRLGGSDDLSNLEAVTLEEHKQRHLAPSKNALAQRRYRERLVSETRVTEKAR